jgi:hypothetical protein
MHKEGMMDGQALFDKLEEIEKAITNHVMTEIQLNRDLITEIQQEAMLIRGSLHANTGEIRVLNDRVHRLVEQLKDMKMIG